MCGCLQCVWLTMCMKREVKTKRSQWSYNIVHRWLFRSRLVWRWGSLRDPLHIITKPARPTDTRGRAGCVTGGLQSQSVHALWPRAMIGVLYRATTPLYATPAIQQVTMATEHAHQQRQQLAGPARQLFSGEKSFGRWRHLVGGLVWRALIKSYTMTDQQVLTRW